MGNSFTLPMGFLFTVIMGFLLTIALAIQLTISSKLTGATGAPSRSSPRGWGWASWTGER